MIENYRINFLIPVLITILWLIAPVLSIILILGFISKYKHSNGLRIYLILLISISFGLIAYTQKGNAGASMETDIVRYYYLYEKFANMNVDTFFNNYFLNSPNILFELGTYFLAQLFPKNNQVFSLFWISLSYFFTLLASLKILKVFELDQNKKNIAYTILLVLFSFMFFTFQTDMIKQSTSLAVFYYSLACSLNNQRVKSILFLIASCLLHTSVFFLLPIFFLYRFRNKLMIGILLVAFAVVFYLVNDTVILTKILNLVSFKYLMLLAGKALYYAKDNEAIEHWRINKFHITILLLLGTILILNTVSRKKTQNSRSSNELYLITLLSFFTLLATITNVHSFLRLINMYSILYLIPIILFIKECKMERISKNTLSVVYVVFFTFFNFFYLYTRTIREGLIYGSSYMDNSLVDIMFSPVPVFLLFNAS